MIQKQNLPINFAQGIDTKTDPWQLAPGNFLALTNQVFTKGNRLTKRNGYKELASFPGATYLTTLNDNLTAIGETIYAYNASSSTVVSRGAIQPMELSTLPLLRNNLNQSQCDTAVSPNGLVCTVYTEMNNTTATHSYVIADSRTGQNIIKPTRIVGSSGTTTGSARVFVLGNFFVIVFTTVISSTPHLQYIAVSLVNPSNVTAPEDIASSYVSNPGLSWDGFVVGASLYLAYNTTSGGQAIKVTYLTAGAAAAGAAPTAPYILAGYTATLVSVCADLTLNSPIIYVTIYDDAGPTGQTFALDTNLNLVMIPVSTIEPNILNVTSAAQNGVCTIFYEVANTYSYDMAIETNFIGVATVSVAGSPVSFRSIFSSGTSTITASSGTGLSGIMFLVDVTTPANIDVGTNFSVSGVTLTLSSPTAGNSALSPGDSMLAQAVSVESGGFTAFSVGLASKAFIVDGTIYLLSVYSSAFQPTYFLLNGSTSTSDNPVVVAKLAYQNGGGYLRLGLPSVSVLNGNECHVGYLFKDLIASVNKGTNLSSGTQVDGIYSQTGVNLGSFTIGTENIDTSEIGKDLLISGGFLWMYDGYLPVEQNFFLYPDNVEATVEDDITTTGTVSNSVTPTHITSVGSTAGIIPGMTITGTAIPLGTTVVSVAGSTIVMSAAATAAHSGESIVFGGQQTAQKYFYQVTYEWTDNQGNAYRSAPSIPVTATTTSGHSFVTLDIPTLRLTYKTANPVKIVVYRYSVAQEIYYQVTSITAPLLNDLSKDFVSFVDVLSDAEILGNNIIYTNGSVVEDVNGPASNIFTLFDTRFWMVDAEDTNLLWFSKQVIEATPVEMSDLFTRFVAPTTAAQGSTGPITALAPMDDKLIIFKANAIYYINGTGPDNTGANNQYSEPIFVTATVGCANQQSIVFQPNGLMFQSEKGIWLLGRDLSTTYIGSGVEEFNSSVVQSAVNVPETNQVRFTLNTGQTLMYDYFYGQWGTFQGVPAISSCIYGGFHTFLNSFGGVYQENPGSYLDGSSPVLLGLTSAWFNLAGLQGYTRAYFFYLLGQYLTPHKLMVSVAYDYNPSPSQASLITPTNFSQVYGGPNPNPNDGSDSADPFGQESPMGGEGNVEQWRVFLTKQRCQAFQITIQEVYDPSFGVTAGAGLTLSGINLIYGVKQKFRPIAARNSIGGGTR